MNHNGNSGTFLYLCQKLFVDSRSLTSWKSPGDATEAHTAEVPPSSVIDVPHTIFLTHGTAGCII